MAVAAAVAAAAAAAAAAAVAASSQPQSLSIDETKKKSKMSQSTRWNVTIGKLDESHNRFRWLQQSSCFINSIRAAASTPSCQISI